MVIFFALRVFNGAVLEGPKLILEFPRLVLERVAERDAEEAEEVDGGTS